MSRPRFLADQDFNEHIRGGVKRREPAVEFPSVRDVGLDGGADADVLERATAEEWTVLSHDVHTVTAAAAARLAAGKPMMGLLLVHQLDPVRMVIDELLVIWECSEAEEWIGQICFLPL